MTIQIQKIQNIYNNKEQETSNLANKTEEQRMTW